MTIALDKKILRQEIDHKLDMMIEQFYKEVPGGSYQKNSKEINVEYYKRHCVETILRIRHKRTIDALVMALSHLQTQFQKSHKSKILVATIPLKL